MEVQLTEREGEVDIMWIEGVRDEVVWETDKAGMEGDLIQSERHRATGWAIKHWRNSLAKSRLSWPSPCPLNPAYNMS